MSTDGRLLELPRDESWRTQQEQVTALLDAARDLASTLELRPLLKLLLDHLEGLVDYAGTAMALVDEATQILAADKATVLVWNGSRDRLVLAAARGFNAESVDRLQRGLHEGITTEVAHTGAPIAVEDAQDDPRVARSITVPEQIRSLLHVPILLDGEVFGVFGINYCQPRRFTGDEQRLLSALAQCAALAIQNARLYAESERWSREIERLYRADAALHASLKLEDVLQALVDVATELPGADKTAVMVCDSAHQRLQARAGRGFSPTTRARMVHGPGDGVTWRVAETGEPIVVNDVRQDPRVARHLSDPEGNRSFLQVPIKIGGEVFGVFGVNHCELHHSVTQSLYGISLYVEAASRALADSDVGSVGANLTDIRETTQDALGEMRLRLYELRSSQLEEHGLADALRSRLRTVERRAGLETSFESAGHERLPAEQEQELFRVAQEALNNVLKHARARRVAVRLDIGTSSTLLEITDDGVGFAPQRGGGGFGLRGMRERVDRLGGTLQGLSEPGGGTRIRVEAPR